MGGYFFVASNDHHRPVYGVKERNRNMDSHTGLEDSGEALYGTYDLDCYSTLAFSVNFESVRPLDETSEVTHVEDNLYASVVKCKREDSNQKLSHTRVIFEEKYRHTRKK